MATVSFSPPGQWETVGKPKKNGGAKQDNGVAVKEKVTKNEKKKFLENAPKVEDVLPLSQVANLFNIFDINKEHEKEREKERAKKKTVEAENAKKSEQQKKAASNAKKKAEKKEFKERPPRSLDEALHKLKEEELLNLLTNLRLRFHENRLVWLRDMCSFLNLRLNVEVDDQTLSGRRWNYPSSGLPLAVKRLLEKLLADCSNQVLQVFFNSCLAGMAHDMVRGLTANGSKLLLQLILAQSPGVVLGVLPQVKDLWNSYQNRQPIGLALLWALGQAGYHNLRVGLLVWTQAMLPALPLRSYSRYVVDYLASLLKQHSGQQTKKGEEEEEVLGVKEFFNLLDLIFSPQLNVSALIRKDLLGLYPKIKTVAFGAMPEKRLRQFFPSFLTRLQPTCPSPFKDELLVCLVQCLSSDVQTIPRWCQLYPSHLAQSAVLLRHLDSCWSSSGLGKNISSAAMLKALTTFETINQEIMAKGKGKQPGVKECQARVQSLLVKMNSRSSFPWRWANLLLLLLIVGVISYDVRKHGSFKGSSTGRFLQDIGAMPYCDMAIAKVHSYSLIAYKWSQANLPYYYSKVAEFLHPYWKLFREGFMVTMSHLANIMANIGAFIRVKTPLLMQTLNSYAPGLTDAICYYSWEAWLLLYRYSLLVWEFIVYYAQIALVWLKNNVFVGELSPENLQKYTWNALHTAQQYALKTYQWVVHQVHLMSK